ncbi:head GIN domain-containing protein [Pedobacter nyackensis]|uniref:head GIN domain-containing protein n=1 Tax=Pedobacter nyackensis TaxID=475255 RepID=UPI0029313D41|nr:head GIN domain-containing protein [Pedobacter nyackensis]
MKPLLAILLVAASFTQINNISAASPTSIKTINFSSDEREVKNFNGIVAGGPIEVIVKFGTKESLRFEGDKEAISTLVSEVKGDKLVIRPQTSWVSWAKKYENKKITAYVTAKQLSSLTMSGNGSIIVSGTITAAEFATTLSGSGIIKANVEADKITGVISGSGAANITGKAETASVTLSGPGSFGSKALNIDQLSARISGKGSINISTNGSIKAVISGSGHVYYSGNPEIEKTVLGSGGVIER